VGRVDDVLWRNVKLGTDGGGTWVRDVAAVDVIDAISGSEIGGASLTARVAVEELVCASWGSRCTGRSLRACFVRQVGEVAPLYRGVLTADVDGRVCWGPGEGEEVSRIGVEKRIDDISWRQILRTPNLFSMIKVRGTGPMTRKRQLTRTVLSPVDRTGDIRIADNLDGTHQRS
jgi:hypothetical protein